MDKLRWMNLNQIISISFIHTPVAVNPEIISSKLVEQYLRVTLAVPSGIGRHVFKMKSWIWNIGKNRWLLGRRSRQDNARRHYSFTGSWNQFLLQLWWTRQTRPTQVGSGNFSKLGTARRSQRTLDTSQWSDKVFIGETRV